MPIIIHLSQGQETVISEEDSDLESYTWSLWTNPSNNHGYAARVFRDERKKPKFMYLHRIILARIVGRELSKTDQCDHKDTNTLNNCRDNLRLANSSQNLANRGRQKNNRSGFKGVAKHRNKWKAYIHINGEQFHLGTFNSPEEAHEAYKKAAVKHFGEFARFDE